MRAGLAGGLVGLVGLGLIPLLIAMLHEKREEAHQVAAVCVSQLTYHPTALRQLLYYFRLNEELCHTMMRQSNNFKPSYNFIASWKHFCPKL